MKAQDLFAFAMAAALIGLGLAVDTDRDPGLVSRLRTANANLDRMRLLSNSSDWFFDFTKQQNTYTWAPGGVTNANAATFPAVIGQGMTMAMLNLGACSLLPAHLHPRASNFVVAVKGTTQTIMINENGANQITQTLTPGQMTIFPAGSVHTMMNVGCEDAQLVSALNSEDTGTLNIANTLFGLPSNFVQAAMGQSVDVQGLKATIPSVGTGSIWGLEECIKACGKGQKDTRSDTPVAGLDSRIMRARR